MDKKAFFLYNHFFFLISTLISYFLMFPLLIIHFFFPLLSAEVTIFRIFLIFSILSFIFGFISVFNSLFGEKNEEEAKKSIITVIRLGIRILAVGIIYLFF